MRILIAISLLFSLTCNGQSGLMTAGSTSENKDTAPASTYSTAVQQVLDRLTNPSLEVQEAIAEAIDSLVSYGYWPDSIYIAKIVNLDSQNNSDVDLTGNFPDGEFGDGASPGFWTQFKGIKGQFDGAYNTKFNPTTLAEFDITNCAVLIYVDTVDSGSTDANIVWGSIEGSGDSWLEDERAGLDITAALGSTAVTQYNTSAMVAKKLYTVARPDGSNLEIWENNTQLVTEADAGSTETDTEWRVGGGWDGANVVQEWNGRWTAFFVTTSNIVYDSVRLVIERLNARLLPNEDWEETIMVQFEDSLKTDDIWDHTEFVVKLGRTIESKVHNLKDGEVPTLFTDVGSPTFIANKGYQFIGTSGLDTNYQPHDSLDENLAIIWKGTLLTGETTDNFLVGSKSATATTGIRVSTTDNNVVGYLNATGPVGNLADGIDTTSFFVAARLASDSVKAFHKDTLLNARTRTFVDYPGTDFHIGGLDSAGVFIEGSFSIAEWVWVGDTTLLDKLPEISNHMLMVDTTFASNTPPSGDITPPTTPGINTTVVGATDLSFEIIPLPTDANGVDHIDVELDQIQNQTIAGDATGFTISGLTASTSYDVRIRAFDVAGNASNWSNEITVSTSSGGGGPSLTITIDFETDPGQPPLKVTGPGTIAERTITDPTDAGNIVSEHFMEITDGTTLNTNHSSRREYEYHEGISGAPNRYTPWFSESAFRFRIYFPTDHDGTDGDRWQTFSQGHHWAQDPQTGGPPWVLQTQDLDGDDLHDIRLKIRYTDLVDDNVEVQNNNVFVSSRDVFAENTWYWIVIDQTPDYRPNGSGGAGILKVYVSDSGFPTLSDLVLDHEGPVGFNNSSGYSMYPQLGMYWADTRNAAKLLELWNDGVRIQHWYIDDWTHQNQHLITP